MLLKSVIFKRIKSIYHQINQLNLRLITTKNTSDSQLKWKRISDYMKKMPPSRENPLVTTLSTPEFKSIFTPELDALRSIFKKYNHELRVAGGAVRDILMGISPKDVDFASTATPTEMKAFFTEEKIRMINPNGERHGTITVRINDKSNFEITTLRIDVITDGRHADIEFTTDWKLDANRRDLTINSMFLDFDGNVYDYFFGYDDLNKRRIVFVGNAGTRICEDYLRILRYFRFYGRIAENPDNHEESTIKAIKDNVDGLERISGERIWMEWSKILDGNFGMQLTLKMIECNLTKYIGLPSNENVDLENFKAVCQRAQANNFQLQPITMITALLKDAREVLDLHNRLHLSAYQRDMALFIVQNRDVKDPENPLFPYKLSMLTFDKKYVIKEYILELLRYKGEVELLEQMKEWELPKFPVNGLDLKPHVQNRKLMSQVLMSLKKVWLLNDCKTSKEDLMTMVGDIVKELGDNIEDNSEKPVAKKIKKSVDKKINKL